MSDIKLFSLKGDGVSELAGHMAALESNLQKQIEANMPTFLGMRFLASEYDTGKTHKGRIDSLALDENGCPVIIEYKRSKNENVINQGLFYLDWLLDHQAEFQLLVMKVLGAEAAETIEWSGTRLVCIAADYNRYDEHAVQQINRNIELMRYRYFGDDLLLLELVNVQEAQVMAARSRNTVQNSQAIESEIESTQANGDASLKVVSSNETRRDTHEDRKQQASAGHLELYNQICDFALSLGDEVQRKELKFYTAIKVIKNFASVQVWAPVRDPSIRIYLTLDPDSINLEAGFTADMRDKGHWGTGDLEVIVRNAGDVEKAKVLIALSYDLS